MNSADQTVQELRQAYIDTEKPKAKPRNVKIDRGERIHLNGAPAQVLNVTEKSLTVRLDEPIMATIKGVPVYVSKLIGTRDLVLKIVTPNMLLRIQQKGK